MGEHLMPAIDPLGKKIGLDGWTYLGIGVAKKKVTTLGQSADNFVMIPITACLKQYGSHNNSLRIAGKATSAGVPLKEAVDEAHVAVRAQRHAPPRGNDSFDIETNPSRPRPWTGLRTTFCLST